MGNFDFFREKQSNDFWFFSPLFRFLGVLFGNLLRVHFFECVSISRISAPFNGHFPFTLVKFKNSSLFWIKLHIRALLLELKTLTKKLNEKLFFSKLKKMLKKNVWEILTFFEKKVQHFFEIWKILGFSRIKKSKKIWTQISSSKNFRFLYSWKSQYFSDF